MNKNKDKGMFREAKHKWLSEIITFESLPKVYKAIEILNEIYFDPEKAKEWIEKYGPKEDLNLSKDELREIILKAVRLAANRAKALAKQKRFGPAEKKKFEKIAEEYEALYEYLSSGCKYKPKEKSEGKTLFDLLKKK